MVWTYGKLAIFFTRLHYRKLGEMHRRRSIESPPPNGIKLAAMSKVGRIFDAEYRTARYPEDTK